MSHFKLIKLKNDNVNSMLFDSMQIEFDFRAETLEQMLDAYRDFLRGCGFSIEGALEVVGPDIVLEYNESNGDEA